MVSVRKFFGKTAREALLALKSELGADAVVLSNRAVAGGVEIVALPAESMGELNATVRAARQPAPPPAMPSRTLPTSDFPPEDEHSANIGKQIAAQLARRSQSAPKPVFRTGIDAPAHDEDTGGHQMVRSFNPPRVTLDADRRVVPSHQPPRPEAPRNTRPDRPDLPERRRAAVEDGYANDARVQSLEATNAQLMQELSSIKGMLERQLAGFAWSEISRNAPARTQMMSELLEAGFSAQLTRRLTENIPGEAQINEARDEVRRMINRDLRVQDNTNDIIDRGGVYALVGPTGVGKTTTTAKLAARCVVRHGAEQLALITTDGYRIGAHEQLRIYGRILGVQVHVVRDAADLRQTLQDLRKKHMVLIDTVGMGQRDKMVNEQSAMLTSAGNVRRLLCLNATARGDTLDDVVSAYEGPDLAGCIFTKLDEAASVAPALDVAMRHELSLFYIANGQRVPEDLHVPNRTYLIHRAMREIAADSPHKIDRADTGLLMATARAPSTTRGAAGV
ncbi:flagellar biosynthesis protein FlhF [Uliginosibacterium sp. H3]|uniref:Flagellar biosynthesis protein FlhF n=1 Tax=Uliginosibacterium silvisoli TaxID=3114758 RepID=A0ABU6K827_9RHOO|nr:flagellar biosynthesis protein FlhF [Uliginosibacterium sp. H3]